MANIGRSWKRYMVVSCSHGSLSHPKALKAALKFKESWKPHTTAHLGDYIDMAALRSGAPGSSDEAANLTDDLQCGLRFLEALEPNILLNGNHEIRLYKDLNHFNAIRARCAASIIGDVRNLAERLHCRFIEHYDITRSWVMIGDTKLLHGFMYNENAVRDHASHFGRSIIGHLHRPETASGPRCDEPVCVCVGWLGDREKTTYANTRRATSRWGHGLAWGEYTDTKTVTRLWRMEETGYRLPL